GALALPWAVLVSGTVRLPVSAPRVVRHPRSGAWTFLARLVCWWPRLMEKRSPTDVRGLASPGTPVPAARRLRPLISTLSLMDRRAGSATPDWHPQRPPDADGGRPHRPRRPHDLREPRSARRRRPAPAASRQRRTSARAAPAQHRGPDVSDDRAHQPRVGPAPSPPGPAQPLDVGEPTRTARDYRHLRRASQQRLDNTQP